MNQTKSSPVACTVGIDYALAAPHLFSVRLTGCEAEPPRKVPADRASVRAFFADLTARLPEGARIPVAFEGSGRQLHGLLETVEGIELYPINPLASDMLRRACHLSGAKSDAIDAVTLRDFLERNLDRLPLRPGLDAQSRKLAMLSEDRRALVDQRKAAGNRMIDAVRYDFPALAAAFGCFLSSFAHLVSEHPDLHRLARRRPETLQKIIRAHGPIGTAKLKRVLAAIAALDPTADPIRWRLAGVYARGALQLHQEIAAYDKEIEALYKAHPLHAFAESLPGIGPALGPRLCAFLGVDPQRWTASADMLQRSGVAPVQRQSGAAPARVYRRRACRKHDLQTFVEFARCSTFSCPWANAFFKAQRAKGKSANTAYRALAFKWIRIIHACIKAGALYDESKVRSPYQITQ